MDLATRMLDSTIFWIVVLCLATIAFAVIRAMEIQAGFKRKRDEIRRARDPEQRRAWAAYLGERTRAERLRKEGKG